MAKKGWYFESNRHRLASKGIKTGHLRGTSHNLKEKTDKYFLKPSGVPSYDNVTFYANKNSKEIIYYQKDDLGKGWYLVRVGDYAKKTRNPMQIRQEFMDKYYRGYEKISLFSELSYHSSKNNPNKIQKYGTHDYTMGVSDYKPIDDYKLLNPVYSNEKNKFGKEVKNVKLLSWRYVALDWKPNGNKKITLQIKDNQHNPFEEQPRQIYLSKEYPLSQKKKAIADFRKYVKKEKIIR